MTLLNSTRNNFCKKTAHVKRVGFLLDLSVSGSETGLPESYPRRLLRGKSLFRKTTGRSQNVTCKAQEESTNLRNPGSGTVFDLLWDIRPGHPGAAARL